MTVVGVYPAQALASSRRLFDALELAFPVRFAPWGGTPGAQAMLVAGPALADATAPGVPTLMLVGDARHRREDVTIKAVPAVDRRLHALTLPGEATSGKLEVGEGDQVLAAGPGGAAWTRAGDTDRVRAALPVLKLGEVLRQALVPKRALALVTIVEFLRRLTAGGSHEPAPLRAAFLFDDPNLRWRSYGYIDYAELVRHADEHGYHAAMAMVPLDASRPHQWSVQLFRERPDRLSLVIHGNNHEKLELLSQRDPGAALALGAQALRRVARFSATSGVHVGRVMVPPHGMCSQTMVRALGRLPFTALCAIHPFPWHGTPPGDQLLAGWEPAAFPEGCAVIPRLPLWCNEADIALRAYVDQPIVLYGHHQDVADGLDVLAAAAARVNRMGPVEWMGPEAIALSNAALKWDGDAVSVRAFANRLSLPAHAATVAVEDPGGEFIGWSLGRDPQVHAFGEPVAAVGGELWLRAESEVDPADVPSPPLKVWPKLRRIATESRDRLAPLRRSS